MAIVDSELIRHIGTARIGGLEYRLHISERNEHVVCAVIGTAEDGSCLPPARWGEGVTAVDALLGDTSERRRAMPFPYCSLFIRQPEASVQIRTREHYLIDINGDVN